MVLMMTSWLVSGRARQFLEIWENSRCSILFHLEVPGGKWQQVISSPVWAARAARPVFHAPAWYPLDPPASAVTSSRRAPGYRSLPRVSHQQRIDSTANAAVSWSVPTFTNPALA